MKERWNGNDEEKGRVGGGRFKKKKNLVTLCPQVEIQRLLMARKNLRNGESKMVLMAKSWTQIARGNFMNVGFRKEVILKGVVCV